MNLVYKSIILKNLFIVLHNKLQFIVKNVQYKLFYLVYKLIIKKICKSYIIIDL